MGARDGHSNVKTKRRWTQYGETFACHHAAVLSGVFRRVCAAYQQSAEQAEQEFRRRPLGLVDRRQQVVDEVLEQRPVVVVALHRAPGGERGVG